MEVPEEIREYMSMLGKHSAAKLTPEQRTERAKKANRASLEVRRARKAERELENMGTATERSEGTNNENTKEN